MSRRRRPPPPSKGLLSAWTTQRAALAGFGFGLAALLVAAFAESRAVLLVDAGLMLLTFACGASILLISLVDAHLRQRGERVRPIRMVDVALGAVLVVLPGYGLYRLSILLGL